MSRLLGWIQQWVEYITIGFFLGGCFLRTSIQYADDPNLRLAQGVLLAWLIILIAEPSISRKWKPFFYVYLAIQSALIFWLIFSFTDNDFTAVLYAGLAMQIMMRLPPRTGICIIALFTPLIILGFSPYYEIEEIIPLAVIYTAANALLGACAYSVRQANEEQEKENRLFAELQDANLELEESARQVERLSIARERSRLALELHDSVTQTIFSMTLTTRAAFILLEKDPPRVQNQLEHLDQLVRSALEELKKLVQELRPNPESQGSLVRLLRDHAARLEDEGLTVKVQIQGEEDLASGEAQCLFRIVQESLNNVIKHAHTDKAWVELNFNPPAILEIRDEGPGFNVSRQKTGVGLSGMKERAAEFGWRLEIVSRPGQGTRILVKQSRQEKGSANG